MTVLAGGTDRCGEGALAVGQPGECASDVSQRRRIAHGAGRRVVVLEPAGQLVSAGQYLLSRPWHQ
jgi:hypothetical protein